MSLENRNPMEEGEMMTSSKTPQDTDTMSLQERDHDLGKFHPMSCAGSGTNGAVVRCSIPVHELTDIIAKYAPEKLPDTETLAKQVNQVDMEGKHAQVAIKVVNFFWDEACKTYLQMENRALTKLPQFHPNLVHVLCSFEAHIPEAWHEHLPKLMAQWADYDESYTTTFFVMEYFPTTLEELQDIAAPRIPSLLLVSIALSILEGALELEQQRIVHLDLTSSNILAGSNQRYAISDLGINVICQDSSMQCTLEDLDNIAMNRAVTAPEVLWWYDHREECTEDLKQTPIDLSKHTVWCIGLILYKCYAGCEPLPSVDSDVFYKYDISKAPLCTEFDMTSQNESPLLIEFGKLIHQMLQCDSSKRITLSRGLQTVKQIRDRMLEGMEEIESQFSEDGFTFNIVKNGQLLCRARKDLNEQLSDCLQTLDCNPFTSVFYSNGLIFRCENDENEEAKKLPAYATLEGLIAQLTSQSVCLHLRQLPSFLKQSSLTIYVLEEASLHWEGDLSMTLDKLEDLTTQEIMENPMSWIAPLRRMETLVSHMCSRSSTEKSLATSVERYINKFYSILTQHENLSMPLEVGFGRTLACVLWGASCTNDEEISRKSIEIDLFGFLRQLLVRSPVDTKLLDAVCATIGNVLRFDGVWGALDEMSVHYFKEIADLAFIGYRKQRADCDEQVSGLTSLLIKVLTSTNDKMIAEFEDATLLADLFSLLDLHEMLSFDTLCSIFHIGCTMTLSEKVLNANLPVEELTTRSSVLLENHLHDTNTNLLGLGVTFLRNLACIPSHVANKSPALVIACSTAPALLENAMQLHSDDAVINEQGRCAFYNLTISCAKDFQNVLEDQETNLSQSSTDKDVANQGNLISAISERSHNGHYSRNEQIESEGDIVVAVPEEVYPEWSPSKTSMERITTFMKHNQCVVILGILCCILLILLIISLSN